MKKHTQTRQAQLLLGLVGAIALLVGASLFSSSSDLGAAILRTSNDPKVFFQPPTTDPGCTAWLVHQHTGPNFTFWNADKTVALAQNGTTLTKDLKLTVPAGNYIKYVAYSGADNHAMNFKLTDAQNQQVGGWYVFSAANNKAPYRFDGSVDTNNAVNIYFKAGHPLQSFNFLAVSYCPAQMSSSSQTSSQSSQYSSANPIIVFARPLASSDTAVSNQRNVKLFRFDTFDAFRNIKLEQIEFSATSPADLRNATNYTLKWDSNGDGVVDSTLQSGVSQQNGKVIFNALSNHVITPAQTRAFEVYGDIASSLSTSHLQLQFSTGGAVLTAKNVTTNTPVNSGTVYKYDGSLSYTYNGDGRDIYLHLGDGTSYTLKNSGDLYVSSSPAPIRNHQLLGGKLEDEILNLNFRAEYEDIEVTDLILSANGMHSNAFANDVDSLELYKAGSTSPFAVITVGRCSGISDVPANSMCTNLATKQLIVPRGSSVDVLVRPRIKSDEQGSISGHMFALYLDPTSSQGSGTGSIRARGVQSSNVLLNNDGDTLSEGEVFIGTNVPSGNRPVQGNLNQIVHSKIVSITNGDPNPDGTSLPTGSASPIGQFTFAAAPHNNTKNGSNKWVLNNILFKVVTKGLSWSGDPNFYKIYNKANPAVSVSCQGSSASFQEPNAQPVWCKNLANSAVNTQLASGESMTLVLTRDMLDPPSQEASIQVFLKNFTDATATQLANQFGENGSAIEWLDVDNLESAAFKWIDYPETIIKSTLYRH